jgi:hypothetical protein
MPIMSYVNDGIYQRNIVRSDSMSCDVIKSEEMTTHMRLTYYKLPYTIIANLRYGEYWHYTLININGSSTENAFTMIRDWLNKCNSLRQLDFSPNYTVKYNINSARRAGYVPISLDKLKIENGYLHSIVARN